jgi:Mn-dependent DtxR family transcriptional regulator
MADENKGVDAPENKDEVIAKLNEQIENLNKGIATTRDEAKTAKAEAAKATETATQALTKLAEIEKIKDKKDDGVVLTPEEEKKLAAYAQKHGLVSKADLDAQRYQANAEAIKGYENQAVAEFLEKHPEYDDDDKWKEVMTEFGLYRQPTTLLISP